MVTSIRQHIAWDKNSVAIKNVNLKCDCNKTYASKTNLLKYYIYKRNLNNYNTATIFPCFILKALVIIALWSH